MALTPITPAGDPVAPILSPVGWQASGTGASGQVFNQEDFINVWYNFTTKLELIGWPTSGTTVSGMNMTFNGYSRGDTFDWFTSSTSGGEQNIRQSHNISYSSTDTAGSALGTQGIIYTLSAGIKQAWKASADSDYLYNIDYPNVWLPTGNNTMFVQDQVAAQALVRQIITYINTGGLEYSYNAQKENVALTTPIPTFDLSLII